MLMLNTKLSYKLHITLFYFIIKLFSKIVYYYVSLKARLSKIHKYIYIYIYIKCCQVGLGSEFHFTGTYNGGLVDQSLSTLPLAVTGNSIQKRTSAEQSSYIDSPTFKPQVTIIFVSYTFSTETSFLIVIRTLMMLVTRNNIFSKTNTLISDSKLINCLFVSFTRS